MNSHTRALLSRVACRQSPAQVHSQDDDDSSPTSRSPLRERTCVANDEPAALPRTASAAPAFITALAPRRAESRGRAGPDVAFKAHARLRAHADAPQGLAEDHGRLLRQRAALEGEGAGRGDERRRSCGAAAAAVVIQEYIGYKSINDPLYRSEKLMVRAAPLLKNPDDIDAYLEAVNLWGQKIQMSSLNAGVGLGQANPNARKRKSRPTCKKRNSTSRSARRILVARGSWSSAGVFADGILVINSYFEATAGWSKTATLTLTKRTVYHAATVRVPFQRRSLTARSLSSLWIDPDWTRPI